MPDISPFDLKIHQDNEKESISDIPRGSLFYKKDPLAKNHKGILIFYQYMPSMPAPWGI